MTEDQIISIDGDVSFSEYYHYLKGALISLGVSLSDIKDMDVKTMENAVDHGVYSGRVKPFEDPSKSSGIQIGKATDKDALDAWVRSMGGTVKNG